MYQFSYAEIQQDDVSEARDRERQLFDRSIALLSDAKEKGAGTPAAIDAVFFVRRVWTLFVEDLGSAENELDTELRANLISIGIWILKESERIRRHESENFDGIIAILTVIRDGLK